MYLFLDESGNLGKDLQKSGTSKYFILTILCCEDKGVVNKFEKAYKRVFQRKLKIRNKKSASEIELKGSNTNIHLKRYFLNQLPDKGWSVFSCVIDKPHAFQVLANPNPHYFYDFYSQKLFTQLFSERKISSDILLVADKCKAKRARTNFDYALVTAFDELNNTTSKHKFRIIHETSHSYSLLQITDLFCWGIYRKYEHSDIEWFQHYEDKVLEIGVYRKLTVPNTGSS